ncbi:hypothetical protein [Planktotalea sp.]|uniref:hypothetical protein n=1 Tax=Planktotalea sp. TaxID=2029877 RepID=UPI003299C5D8
MERNLVKELSVLLESEHDALMAGNITLFEKLVAQKTQVLLTVSALPMSDLKRFEKMRPLLQRNQRLAQSAIKGMRVAIKRAKDIKDVSLGLQTYKKDGSGRSIAMRSARSLSKRS